MCLAAAKRYTATGDLLLYSNILYFRDVLMRIISGIVSARYVHPQRFKCIFVSNADVGRSYTESH